MTSRESDLDPLRLDVETFAAERRQLEGRWLLRDLPRIVESMAPDAPPPGPEDVVTWRAAGEQVARAGEPEAWLQLAATATLMLQCQRCLSPLPVALDVHRRIRFVHGEDAAAQLDASSEDDVLAMTRALDLRALVEDELLLAAPLVPLHDVCPEPLPGLGDEDAKIDVPSPFAVLAGLKRSDKAN